MTTDTLGYPDLTKDRGRDGLPPGRRRDFFEVAERLADLPEGQWGLIEIAPTISRANSIRKTLLTNHPQVQLSQRLRDDGKYLMFARLRPKQ